MKGQRSTLVYNFSRAHARATERLDLQIGDIEIKRITDDNGMDLFKVIR